MAEETIFSKIIRREIPSDIVYQDDLVTAFRDISPQAPTHILIIPNILIPTVNDVSAEHEQALGRMITVAAKIAEQEGIAEDGYRLIMNTNRHGGQEVYHIHMHLLGGRPLGPMLAHKGRPLCANIGPRGRPPSKCIWMWYTSCPPWRLVFMIRR